MQTRDRQASSVGGQETEGTQWVLGIINTQRLITGIVNIVGCWEWCGGCIPSLLVETWKGYVRQGENVWFQRATYIYMGGYSTVTVK